MLIIAPFLSCSVLSSTPLSSSQSPKWRGWGVVGLRSPERRVVRAWLWCPVTAPVRRQSNVSVLAATQRVGSGGLVFGLVFVLIVLIPAGRILRRTGYSPWYCLLLLIPLVNIVMIFVFAFSTWPVDRAPRGYGLGRPV